MENKITIRIFGKEVKCKKSDNKFNKYTYTKDGKEFFEVKFTKECKIQPTGTGYILLDLLPEDCGIKKVKGEKDKKYNSILFIRNCSNIRIDKEYEEEMKVKKLEEVKSVL